MGNFALTKERIIEASFVHKYNDKDGNEQDFPVAFSYYESCLTPAFFDAVARYEETHNSSEIAHQLSKNITKWDIDWEGEPFPPSYENLANVCTFNFNMDLVNKMAESVGGEKKKQTQSPNGSADLAKSGKKTASS